MRLSDNEFNKLSEFIKSEYGIFLKEEKKVLVETRLSDMLEKKGISSFEKLYKMLMDGKNIELKREFETKITTNYTYFMREEDTLVFFRDVVLPWIEKICRDKSLRVWSAGCSSGEEPYNLAMIIADYFTIKDKDWNKQILASDISDKMLQIALKAVYSDEKVQCLPSEWIRKYMKKVDSVNYIFKDEIRKEVFLKKINLMEPFYPYKKKFHAIFCRNVMIYFDERTRNTIIKKFYDSLENGGYLLIGKTESIDKRAHKFEYIKPGIYRKRI